MEKFVVSARKYRPSFFSHVVGQSSIITTLQNAIKAKHLAHAFLFCGPRGVGKTTCARILAKAINCQQLTADIEPCNICASCKSFNEGTSFNIYELDAASNNSVEDIRSLVEQVRYSPPHGLYKIYIIDEVHMLSQAAFNAFLKTLEEPPSYVIFILATTEKYKVIPTILSRCQIFDFQRINPAVMVEQLKAIAENEHISYDLEALHFISQKSEGALRDALSMFDVIVSFGAGKLTYEATLENLHILDYSYYFKLTEAFLQGNISACLLIYDEIVRSGFDGLYFLEGLVSHFRSLLVSQDPETLALLEVPSSIQEKYRMQAQQMVPNFLLDALQLGNQCALQYKDSLNKRFHVELTLIELATSHGSFQKKSPTSPLPSSSVLPENKPVRPGANEIPPDSSELISPKRVQEEKTTELLQGSLPITSPASTGSVKKVTLQPTIKIPQVAAIKVNIDTPQPVDMAILPISEDMHAFSQEGILKHWEAYAQQLQMTHRIPAYNLMKNPIELAGSTILLKFTNAIEEHILAEIREELVNYLRYQLGYTGIDIRGILTPQASPHKPYTAQEKFRYLATKNPHLHVFKEQLHLEIMD